MKFPDKVVYRGCPFEYGDDVLIVPPLPLGQSKDIQKKMATLSSGNIETETREESIARMDSRVAIIVEATTKALKRNYPDVTDEVIQDFITQENMNDLFSAALYGSVPTKTAKSVPEAKNVLEKKLNPAQIGSTSTVE
jgi:hypothetical protein